MGFFATIAIFNETDMPTKYSERLILPSDGSEEIVFKTKNGLTIATGYRKVNFSEKKPLIEFVDSMIEKENIFMPLNQQWKEKNPSIQYAEYRSRDYCNIRILRDKTNGRFYISPFDLISDEIPVLISPLRRKKTILAIA